MAKVGRGGTHTYIHTHLALSLSSLSYLSLSLFLFLFHFKIYSLSLSLSPYSQALQLCDNRFYGRRAREDAVLNIRQTTNSVGDYNHVAAVQVAKWNVLVVQKLECLFGRSERRGGYM